MDQTVRPVCQRRDREESPAPILPVPSGNQLRRWHGSVGHTADVGLRATAPDGEGLFEEAAAALAELSADVCSSQEVGSEAIEIEAEDLEQLVFRWLNELIGLSEIRGEALIGAEVSRARPGPLGWTVRGRAWFAPFDATELRPRLQVKAATLHRLRVTHGSEGWTLEAYLDV